MTVQDTTRRAGPYAGTGTQTDFPFTFKAFATADVRVVLEVDGVESDVSTGSYLVTLNANQETSPGGTVSFLTAPVSGASLVILSDVAYDQPLALPGGGNFPPRSVEQQFDRVAMQLQQVREEQGRTLMLPATVSADVSAVLPPPQAGAVVGWDEAAQALQNVDPLTLATIVAFGTSRADVFTGNGSQTAFTLTSNPGALANLDVSMGGITQVPGTDYTWSGTTLTFTAAPPLGVTILVRYFLAMPQGTTDSAASTFSLLGALTRNVQTALREVAVTATAFPGVDPTGVADSTAGLQAALNYVQAIGATDPYNPTFAGAGQNIGVLIIPAGVYRITAPLTITRPCKVRGDGIRRTVIRFATSNNALFAFNIGPTAVGTNMIGGSFGDLTIICNGGAVQAGGIYMSTAASASGITLYEMHNISVLNCRVGVSQTGVIYMSTFRNITVSGTFGGSVELYGWYVTSPQEVVYNTYADLEVTNCASGAYAYYFQVLFSQFRNLTADSVMYMSNPGGGLRGFTIEGLVPSTLPIGIGLDLNQCDLVENVTFINCPHAKMGVGMRILGNCVVNGVRIPDYGAGNQPNQPLLLAGGKGVVQGWQMPRAPVALVETGSAAEMNNWVFVACSDITAFDLTHRNGNWTPTFPSGWTTAPTVISAQYTRIGRQVTVTLYATEGVATAGAQIGGLPFAANSTQGAAAYGSSSDTTDRLAGSILPNGTVIGNIPAVTLTSNFWQLSATYFV